MAINLQRFMSTMNARPPAMASDFEVKIFCPAIGSVDELTFRAENVSLPGRSVATADNLDVGPQRKIGYAAIYPEVSIQFILDERYQNKYNDFLKHLTNNKVENRPIVTGNFARQPIFKLLGYNFDPSNYEGAEILHKRGFFIGLSCSEMSEQKLNKLVNIFYSYKF